MIEKIRNTIDDKMIGNSTLNSTSTNTSTNTSTFSSKYNNSSADIENFDLDSNLVGNSEVTEEMAFNAINENFANNREVTNNMNNKVYNALKNKIDDYIASNGVDSK